MTDSNKTLTPNDILKDAVIRTGILEKGDIRVEDLDDVKVLTLIASDILLELTLNNRLLQKRLNFSGKALDKAVKM